MRFAALQHVARANHLTPVQPRNYEADAARRLALHADAIEEIVAGLNPLLVDLSEFGR